MSCHNSIFCFSLSHEFLFASVRGAWTGGQLSFSFHPNIGCLCSFNNANRKNKLAVDSCCSRWCPFFLSFFPVITVATDNSGVLYVYGYERIFFLILINFQRQQFSPIVFARKLLSNHTDFGIAWKRSLGRFCPVCRDILCEHYDNWSVSLPSFFRRNCLDRTKQEIVCRG